jgi:hypothetical protein
MGRQIAVALTQIDETAFLDFLHGEADIKLIDFFAPSQRELWVESFADELTGHWTYHIWNQHFPWIPAYSRVKGDAYHKEHIGWYHIANLDAAPVIEFSRSDVAQAKYGRLYWAKYFSAPRGLGYNVDEFSGWYDSVVHWIRRHTAGKVKRGWVTWFLPDAWRVHTEMAEQEKSDA